MRVFSTLGHLSVYKGPGKPWTISASGMQAFVQLPPLPFGRRLILGCSYGIALSGPLILVGPPPPAPPVETTGWGIRDGAAKSSPTPGRTLFGAEFSLLTPLTQWKAVTFKRPLVSSSDRLLTLETDTLDPASFWWFNVWGVDVVDLPASSGRAAPLWTLPK